MRFSLLSLCSNTFSASEVPVGLAHLFSEKNTLRSVKLMGALNASILHIVSINALSINFILVIGPKYSDWSISLNAR